MITNTVNIVYSVRAPWGRVRQKDRLKGGWPKNGVQRRWFKSEISGASHRARPHKEGQEIED